MGRVKRPYRGPYRRQQATRQSDITERIIADAARTLFTRDGYAATTIERIAREAGVAVPTVYARFRTKRRIFERLLDFAQSDPELAQLGERAVGSDAETQLRLAATFNRVYFGRECALLDALVGAAAADPALATLRDRQESERQDRCQRLVKGLAAARRLRPKLSERQATAALFALSGPEIFRLLVIKSGWSPQQYEKWLLRAVDALILATRG